MRRVILILTDGLRPEAITPSRMPSLHALASEYTAATRATTIRPSRTVAALASLATGVAPETHGLIEPGLGFLRRLPTLKPLARELVRHDVPTWVVSGELSAMEWSIVRVLCTAAGTAGLATSGRRARDVARSALRVAAGVTGVVFVYLNDCDLAGHAHGWMSDEYLKAAEELDRAVAMLAPLRHDSLLVLASDHGGGGVTSTDHHEPHPLNDAIPLVLAGPGIARGLRLVEAVSLLDVPPTICRWLGVPTPDGYEGRALDEAFEAPAFAAEVPS